MLVTFDTQEAVNQLKNHGFTDEQAEVLTKIQKQIIHDSMGSTLGGKGDINGLKNDIVEVKTELKADIQGVDKRIEQLNTQLIVIKWMLGMIIAVEILPLLKQLF